MLERRKERTVKRLIDVALFQRVGAGNGKMKKRLYLTNEGFLN